MLKYTALRRVWPYVRPYRRQLITMLLVALASIAGEIAIPVLIQQVIDGPITDGNRGWLWVLTGLVLAVGAFEAFLAFLRRYILSVAATDIETNLRNDIYRHLQKLHIGFHDQWQTGQLLARAISDTRVIRRFVGFGLIFLIVNAFTFIGVTILLMRLHVPLALFTAISAIPIVMLSTRFEKRYRAISRRVQDEQGDLATSIEESASGIRVIKAFGRRDLMGQQFRGRAKTLYESNMTAVTLRARFWTLLGGVPKLTQAAVLFGGAIAVARGNLTVGGLTAFFLLLNMLIWPVEALGWILAIAEEAETGAQRIFEVFDTEPEIAERKGARNLTSGKGQGRIRFESVRFTYPDTKQEILRGVDLEIEPGETMAIVGATGSGKTTLLSLVPRLYDPTSGRVTLDGVDVRDLTLDALRRNVGVAFEDPLLFSASVRENLLMGRPEATEEDLHVALEVAQASFVDRLPWGLDTRVGEQGLSLSGGQRQRLALARAVLARPRVIVLDDPLSALDVHTEHLVEEALETVLDGVTGLLVVHRPSTIRLADRVALLQDGVITHVGRHSDLMRDVPAYRLILSQEVDEEQSVEEETGAVA
ncbi:MAG TPA: ABC transporter ATP-binding protein [Acidimicrobiales bacterium]|nr:ABC transporter ATP-binding protein [Acidimicrobiales bacterium]